MRKNINNLLLIISIILSLFTISILNADTIPVHFNELGDIDRYGSKFELLIMPCLFFIIYFIIKMIKYYIILENQKLFNFLSFELLLFMNFLFTIIYINLIYIVNFNYESFLIDISYSCSCFLSYFILHFGIRVKNLVINIKNRKMQLNSFFNLSIFLFTFSIILNILFINKMLALPINLIIYGMSLILASIYIFLNNYYQKYR